MSEELEPTGETITERRYPWPLWLNGRPHRLAWQEDFDPEPKTFANYAYARARRAGLRLAVCVEPTDCVVIQAYPQGGRKPVLPSPYRRLANGRLDSTAGTTDRLKTSQDHDPERECRRCGARLTPASILAGECRKFSDPTYRCEVTT